MPLSQDIGFAIESNASSVAFLDEPLRATRRDLGQAAAELAQQRGAAMPLQEVVEFARQLLSGTGQPAGAPAAADLSPRERELLTLLAGGRTDQQIAEAMFISIRTVRSHLDRIRDKTGCRRRAELTSFAIEHEMVTGESPRRLLGTRSSSGQPSPEPRVNAA
jgi:DNA-binding CsgD family transcriptional regulator